MVGSNISHKLRLSRVKPADEGTYECRVIDASEGTARQHKVKAYLRVEAARGAGVRRVVLASSNHVMGMYDRHEQWPVYPEQLPRADSLYGVSKIFDEALGRFYHDEHGLDVISLRIGWFSEDPLSAEEDILRAMWLSPGDCTEVVRCAIEAEVRCGLYYAISDNPNRRWSMTNTQLELGYRPRDAWTALPGAQEQVVEGGAPVRDTWPRGS